jgi:hypothetical protein
MSQIEKRECLQFYLCHLCHLWLHSAGVEFTGRHAVASGLGPVGD